MQENTRLGHIAAIFTIAVWATTFISTKVLLLSFQPVEILIIRFVMGFLALYLVAPQRLRGLSFAQEKYFIAAGLTGVCLYFLFENIALTYTSASNAAVIVSCSPFTTAILSQVFNRTENGLRPQFFLGFILAIIGISLIIFNGAEFHLNPTGDLLAVGAGVVWSCYALLTRKISSFGYPVIPATRHIFFYGILFMLPAWFYFDCRLDLTRLADTVNLGNMLFLGLGASAACFATWNYSVSRLGPVKTSIYIYMIPVLAVITAAIILDEKITALSALGTALTLAGLVLSEWGLKDKTA